MYVDIRTNGLFASGLLISVLALCFLYYALKATGLKERINWLTSFFALAIVVMAVFFLAAQSLFRKC
jgi:uncharacterized membrane protein